MAINATASAANGRNVDPINTTLDFKTANVDCSAFTATPVDGQFVFYAGHGQPAGQVPTAGGGNATTAYVAAPGNELLAGNAASRGASLAMIWSEGGRADIQATGYKRVPVKLYGSAHVKLKLYNYDSAALPAAGDPVVVAVNYDPVYGVTGALDSGSISAAGSFAASTRMIATVWGTTASAAKWWVVGYVTKSVATAGDPLECMLYPHPIPMDFA